MPLPVDTPVDPDTLAALNDADETYRDIGSALVELELSKVSLLRQAAEHRARRDALMEKISVERDLPQEVTYSVDSETGVLTYSPEALDYFIRSGRIQPPGMPVPSPSPTQPNPSRTR